MIQFRDVSFEYEKDVPALEAVDVELKPGLALLVGPNGAGKSTFLKLAAGVERPDAGKVAVDGFDLWTDETAARRGLAYVPEFPDVTPYATLREVLNLVCRLRGESVARGAEALQTVGLAAKGGQTIRELSSGERKRALLSTAMVGRPGHLLLDEPLDALDRDMQGKVLSWLTGRAREGAVVAVVSHSLEPFIETASRCLAFAGGRIVRDAALPDDKCARLGLLEELARGHAV